MVLSMAIAESVAGQKSAEARELPPLSLFRKAEKKGGCRSLSSTNPRFRFSVANRERQRPKDGEVVGIEEQLLCRTEDTAMGDDQKLLEASISSRFLKRQGLSLFCRGRHRLLQIVCEAVAQ
jgi:hypothetical protein